MTALDAAKIQAAYGCPESAADKCFEHFVLGTTAQFAQAMARLDSVNNDYTGCT